MPPWDAQIIPDASPVQQMTEHLIKVAFWGCSFWSALFIPDASPVHKITVGITLHFGSFWPFLDARAIPDASGLQQITISGGRVIPNCCAPLGGIPTVKMQQISGW